MYETKLPSEVFSLEGFSGVRTRIFYNELCSYGEKLNYLEVGTWKGSTLIAAMYGNDNVNAYALDNWSQFGGPRVECMELLKKFNMKPTIFDVDFDTFDFNTVPDKIDVYLYDGDHTKKAQYDGIIKVYPILNDESIIIVDDWNWQDVRDGTFQAFSELDANITRKFEIRYTTDNSHTPLDMARREFHNGIGIFLIKKK
jgi:hypothetical protein